MSRASRGDSQQENAEQDDLAIESAREEAQGVEVFEDPDANLPGELRKEGPPGQEVLTGDAAGLAREDDRDQDGESEPE